MWIVTCVMEGRARMPEWRAVFRIRQSTLLLDATQFHTASCSCTHAKFGCHGRVCLYLYLRAKQNFLFLTAKATHDTQTDVVDHISDAVKILEEYERKTSKFVVL